MLQNLRNFILVISLLIPSLVMAATQTVDTELPPAALLQTGMAAPTAPAVNAFLVCKQSDGTYAPCLAGSIAPHDSAASLIDPLLEGCFANATPPTDVSADIDSVRGWCFGNGASAVSAVTAPSGGATPCYLASAGTTNSFNCKASAGQIYGFDVINTSATIYYLRLYNLATAPSCSSATGFVRTIPIFPSPGGITRDISVGEYYSSGIGFCLTGGGSSTDNTVASVGVYITLQIK